MKSSIQKILISKINFELQDIFAKLPLVRLKSLSFCEIVENGTRTTIQP